MREYTVLAVLAVLAVVALERWSGTRVFARAQFWVSMAIVFGFQVLVDGWLTKLSAPIVIYSPDEFLGIRWPWDVPVEDYLFGFAMVGGAIILWERAKQRRRTSETPAAPTDDTTDDTTDTPRAAPAHEEDACSRDQ
ncbi:hypothetical protein GCM10009740_40210 [Terrabacter terrae]|uniref:Lycopene cyclase domain-containing protein n=1 Tax=Terrabacter terrae TaxID=318434 RepID=A0ABP4KMU9_9MICO